MVILNPSFHYGFNKKIYLPIQALAWNNLCISWSKASKFLDLDLSSRAS